MSKLTKAPFKVGDLVTSNMNDLGSIVRKVTMIQKAEICGSGYAASVDGGKPCKSCGKSPTDPINKIDSAWFKPVKNSKKEKK